MHLVVVLLLLSSHVSMVTAVASCHSDRDKDHRPRENCTAAGFNDVPAGFEVSTKVLLFPNNLFSSLSWYSFQVFTEIYEIDLTGNKVPEVTSSVSPILPSLSVLRLGSNSLTSLSDSSFSACPGLTELYLHNNAIDSLSDHTFSGLSRLEILDLSSNRIKVLPELMLHPLPAIETLFLENNKIRVMPDDWFSQKEEVPYLYLSANLWACSCSLGYLRRYLDDYELNVYVRDGLLIKSDGESVVCDSPQWHKGKPVLSLEESDLCSATESAPTGDLYQPITTNTPYKTTTAATTIPTTITVTSPTPTPPTTSPTPPTTSPTPPTTSSTPPTTSPTPPTTSPTPPTTSSTPPTTSSTPPTTSSTPPTTSPTPTATPAFVKEHHTEYHSVITWSWHQTFTRLIESSDYSGSVVRSEVPLVEMHTLASHLTLPSVRPSTESPANTIPSWAIDEPGNQRRGKVIAVGGAGVFCFWLFAGCLLLCVASALCIMMTVARMVMWYRRVYKPLSVMLARKGRDSEGVRLLMHSRREEKEVAVGGVMALYRSVLFIHKEEGEAMEREDGGKEGEGGEGGKERLLVTLEPAEGVIRGDEGQKGGREERGMYRKTLYRLLSKEQEIEGWRHVTEECNVSAEDGGRRGWSKEGGCDRERGGGGDSKKRYSVILREEREEAGGGREELDWVVGGWEVKRGGAPEPRSSWGEWLAHYLPSMPWGLTTPLEGEALHQPAKEHNSTGHETVTKADGGQSRLCS